MWGSCFPFHVYWFCEETTHLAELMRGITSAVAARDVASLADYARLPSVSLVSERLAIQIRGCHDETIAAHIPVDSDLLPSIEAAVAEFEPDR